jgi:diguanylate cyclase (GGDEF)-like protein
VAGERTPLPDVLPDARSWIAVPLAVREDSVGVLLATSPEPDAYTEAHVEIGAALVGQGMVAYDNARLFDRVRQLATEDGLTGIYNRRHLLELAERSHGRAVRGATQLAAIMVDIDHFKRINDTYGHAVGDTVIAEVARRLRTSLRPGDLLGRYGGEEFLLLVHTSPASAHDVADRVLATISGTPVPAGARELRVTASVGVAHLLPTDRDLGALLDRADRALYQAKDQGRDRVAVA